MWYVKSHENLTLFNAYTGLSGLALRIENSSYMSDYSLTSGTQVSPGFHTFISVERALQLNLPKPYSNCDLPNDVPSDELPRTEFLDLFLKSPFRYSQQSCLIQCIQKFTNHTCNCTNPYYLSLIDADPCHMGDPCPIIKAWEAFFLGDYAHTVCMPECPLECNHSEYKTSVSSLKLFGQSFADLLNEQPILSRDFVTRPASADTARESVVGLIVFYGNLDYVYSTESAKIDVVGLLATIGGNLGLFLGVSILSICDLVDLLMHVYTKFERFCLRKRRISF